MGFKFLLESFNYFGGFHIYHFSLCFCKLFSTALKGILYINKSETFLLLKEQIYILNTPAFMYLIAILFSIFIALYFPS